MKKKSSGIPSSVNPSFKYKLIKSAGEVNKKIPSVITETSTESNLVIPEQNSDSSIKESLLRAAAPYDFKTKQRPLEYLFFYRTLSLGLDSTRFNSDFIYQKLAFEVPSRKFVMLNSLKATIMYRYLEESEKPDIYKCYECDFLTPAAQFGWGLNVLNSDTYDSDNDISDVSTLPAYVSLRGEFTTLNKNILENGDSGTTLYLKENTKAYFYYIFMGANSEFFFPTPAGGSLADPIIIFEAKGHISNMSEYFLLENLKK